MSEWLVWHGEKCPGNVRPGPVSAYQLLHVPPRLTSHQWYMCHTGSTLNPHWQHGILFLNPSVYFGGTLTGNYLSPAALESCLTPKLHSQRASIFRCRVAAWQWESGHLCCPPPSPPSTSHLSHLLHLYTTEAFDHQWRSTCTNRVRLNEKEYFSNFIENISRFLSWTLSYSNFQFYIFSS